MATRCSACGAKIVWIRTAAGKSMPCDAQAVPFWTDGSGLGETKKIMTYEGTLISAQLMGDIGRAAGIGFIPHWITCANAGRFRRKRS